MNDNKTIRSVARYVGAVMILLSVFLTWLTTPRGWPWFDTVEMSLLQLAASAGGVGIQRGFASALIFVIFITIFLLIVGVVAALIPTKIAIWDYIVPKAEIGSRSKSYAIARHAKYVAVVGGILSLIGVSLFMLQVSTDPSVVGTSLGLGVFVAILGAAVVIASAAIPEGKKGSVGIRKMARLSQARILLGVGVLILILGLTFVALPPLFASAVQCTINGVPRPVEECFQIFSAIGYGLLALGGLLLVGGFLRGRQSRGAAQP